MNRCMVAGAAVLAVLALPSAASARTYTAYAGPATAKPDGLHPGADLNAFFPKALKIRQGDRVEFRSTGFHTASVLGKNAQRPPLAVPAEGETYEGILDPQGNPFFFNGRQKFKFNEVAFGPTGDGRVDGADTDSSGVIPGDFEKPSEYTLSFNRRGKHTVLCFIHPGMEQKVRVLKRKAKGADRPAKVASRTAKQSRKLWKTAGKVAQEEPKTGEVYAGNERKQAALLAFVPNSVQIKAGTTLSFVNASPSEPHNMIFVGRKQDDGTYAAEQYATAHRDQTNFEPVGPGAPNQLAPGFVYGSEPPAGGVPGTYEYSGDDYGNGFLWTPLMDGLPGDPPNGLLTTERITFTNPGEYKYFCGIHPFMEATVTVTQ